MSEEGTTQGDPIAMPRYALSTIPLIRKLKHDVNSKAAFENIGIQITSDGCPYLGSPMGSKEYVSKYVVAKVSDWSSQIEVLSEIAMSQPHAAYSAFIKSLLSKWIYLCQTTKSIASLLSPLEECIRKKLIPAFTGRGPPSDNIHEFFSAAGRSGYF